MSQRNERTTFGKLSPPVAPNWPAPANPGLRIGEAAALVGVTVKAIRVYHERGILPEAERDASGYRRYPPSALAALAGITRLRAVGLSLRQIEPLLRTGSGEALQASLRDLDTALSAEIAERERRRALLTKLLEEGIDDAIAVSAASPGEERSIAALRTVIPDLTPENELVERRLLRALELLAPAPVGDTGEDEALAALALFGQDPAELAAVHQRFHSLVDVDPGDRRVHDLASELREGLQAMVSTIEQSTPGIEDLNLDRWSHIGDRLAAALSVLAPAQRRVLELAFSLPAP